VSLQDLNVNIPAYYQQRVYGADGARVFIREHDFLPPRQSLCGPLFNLRAAPSLGMMDDPLDNTEVTRGLDPHRSRHSVVSVDLLQDEDVIDLEDPNHNRLAQPKKKPPPKPDLYPLCYMPDVGHIQSQGPFSPFVPTLQDINKFLGPNADRPFIENTHYQGYTELQHSMHLNSTSMTPCGGQATAASGGMADMEPADRIIASTQQAWMDYGSPWARIESCAHATGGNTRLRVENVFSVDFSTVESQTRKGE
jgi:hypothetical protein